MESGSQSEKSHKAGKKNAKRHAKKKEKKEVLKIEHTATACSSTIARDFEQQLPSTTSGDANKRVLESPGEQPPSKFRVKSDDTKDLSVDNPQLLKQIGCSSLNQETYPDLKKTITSSTSDQYSDHKVQGETEKINEQCGDRDNCDRPSEDNNGIGSRRDQGNGEREHDQKQHYGNKDDRDNARRGYDGNQHYHNRDDRGSAPRGCSDNQQYESRGGRGRGRGGYNDNQQYESRGGRGRGRGGYNDNQQYESRGCRGSGRGEYSGNQQYESRDCRGSGRGGYSGNQHHNNRGSRGNAQGGYSGNQQNGNRGGIAQGEHTKNKQHNNRGGRGRCWGNQGNECRRDQSNERGKSEKGYYRKLPDFIKIVKDNLFTADDNVSLAHCVSADFKMGMGIAVEFKNRFNGVEELKRQGVKPGKTAFLKSGNRHIFYLVTKRYYYKKPSFESLESSLKDLKRLILEFKVEELAMPRIASGLDKLDWDDVLDSIIDIFQDSKVSITIYDYKPLY